MPAWLRRPHAALFVLCLAAYGYFYQAGGWNQNVRFDLARALVERQSPRIDGYHQNTGDLSVRDGHYYCDKAPGASLMAAPAYAALRPLGGVDPEDRFLDRVAWISTLWAVGIPAAAGVVALFVLLGAFGLTARAAAALALAYAVGTLAWPYATLLYGHQLAASLVVIAFALVAAPARRLPRALPKAPPETRKVFGPWPRARGWTLVSPSDTSADFDPTSALADSRWILIAPSDGQPRLGSSPPSPTPSPTETPPSTSTPTPSPPPPRGASPLRLLAAGFLLGFAVVAEYPAALAAAPVVLYAAWRVRSWMRLSWLAVGVAIPGLALAAYHTVAFGGPLTLPYEFSNQPYRARGYFMGLGLPHWKAIWGVTFSEHRGLFFSAPWLLLALPGAALLWRRGPRAETVACVAICLLFFWMNFSLLDDWRGGWGIGPRHLIVALPFLTLLCAGCASLARGRPRLRAAGWALGLVPVGYAVFMMLSATAVKPEVDKRIEAPFAQFVLPLFFDGEVAVNTQGIDMKVPAREGRRAFNLGTLLGLDGPMSLLPLLGAALLALIWLAVTLRRGGAPPARGPPEDRPAKA